MLVVRVHTWALLCGFNSLVLHLHLGHRTSRLGLGSSGMIQ